MLAYSFLAVSHNPLYFNDVGCDISFFICAFINLSFFPLYLVVWLKVCLFCLYSKKLDFCFVSLLYCVQFHLFMFLIVFFNIFCLFESWSYREEETQREKTRQKRETERELPLVQSLDVYKGHGDTRPKARAESLFQSHSRGPSTWASCHCFVPDP